MSPVANRYRCAATEGEDDPDAFLKRYEQLVAAIQDDLFETVAILGGERIALLDEMRGLTLAA